MLFVSGFRIDILLCGECRSRLAYTAGTDSKTGKQIQRSITGNSKKEVSQRLREVTSEIDRGVYCAPCKMTIGEWLDIWSTEYLFGVKEGTAYSYRAVIRIHIKPEIGLIRLDALNPHTVQSFYNKKFKELSAKTVKNIHGILHAALRQAVLNGYIPNTPTDSSIRPRIEKKEMYAMVQYMITDFLEAIKGDEYEYLFFVALFTGMRKGEVMGLTWDVVDFARGTVLINKQLQRPRVGDGTCQLVSTKNGKAWKLKPAKEVMNILYRVKKQQMAWQLKNGECFQNPMNLVFTHELGGYQRNDVRVASCGGGRGAYPRGSAKILINKIAEETAACSPRRFAFCTLMEPYILDVVCVGGRCAPFTASATKRRVFGGQFYVAALGASHGP